MLIHQNPICLLLTFGLLGMAPSSFAATTSLWQNPLPGARIVSGFGPRTAPLPNSAANHTGVDLQAQLGTSVHAPFSGIVKRITETKLGGKELILSHGKELSSIYTHLNKIFVLEGQIVQQGNIIAEVGNSGSSTGPHLHFEVRKNEVAIDPKTLIPDWNK